MSVMEHKHEVLSRSGGVLRRDTRVRVDDTDDLTDEPVVNVFARVIYFLASIVVGLLLVRFLLSMLGANRLNAFADFVYSASQPLVAPFFGLFNYQAQFGVARFEFETLIAAFVYVLVAWLLVALIELGGRRTEV
jgi:hypothetical protein